MTTNVQISLNNEDRKTAPALEPQREKEIVYITALVPQSTSELEAPKVQPHSDSRLLQQQEQKTTREMKLMLPRALQGSEFTYD